MRHFEKTGKTRSVARRIGRAVGGVVVVLGAILLGISWWISEHFGVVTIDQVLVNIRGAGGEAGGTSLVVSGVVVGLVIPLIVSGGLLYFARLVRSASWKKTLPRKARIGFTGAVVALLALVPVAGFTSIAHALSLPQYVDSLMSDHDLADYYTAPAIESKPEGTTRNIVIIYMESVEDSLANTSVFEKDMLTPIQEATAGWDSVTLQQPIDGRSTLGGIVNTQCGFPLRMANTNLVGNAINVAGQDVEAYLPNATCLGDILADQGYHSVFMGGANTSFAGKGTFLMDHGYSEVKGRGYWRDHGETEMRSDWGLSVRRLMELAKDEVTTLHDAGQPFNLTLLTLDSHPKDTVYPYCDVDTDQELTSIYDCSMQQVAGFVNYMDEQGYLDDTVVVVMGDHLRIMGSDNTFRDQLESIPDRTIFNRIWSPDSVNFAVHDIDQFSMYPTILEVLGSDLKDGRAGIGVSALEASPSPGSIRDLSRADYDDLVLARSQDFYNWIWGVETTEGGGDPGEATPSSE